MRAAEEHNSAQNNSIKRFQCASPIALESLRVVRQCGTHLEKLNALDGLHIHRMCCRVNIYTLLKKRTVAILQQ